MDKITLLVYYLVLTPIGLLMSMRGKDPLALKNDLKAGSYWVKREKRARRKEDYEKMY